MAKSWSWSVILTAAVDDQASVELDTPDYDETLVDPSSVELAVGNNVVDVPGQATVTFGGATATVVNLTGDDWAQGETVYVYVKAKGLSDVGSGMQAQIDANASAIADLQTRVAALEDAANET